MIIFYPVVTTSTSKTNFCSESATLTWFAGKIPRLYGGPMWTPLYHPENK